MTAAVPGGAAGDAAGEAAGWLARGGPFGGRVPERIDTHGASIFLVGDRAWKIKRPVHYAYMDFSTPAKRERALRDELRLNRRTAPGLYLGVHAVTCEADGALAFDGRGAPVDWALEMRRFPDDALLARHAAAHGLDDGLLRGLADGIVAFHAAAGIAGGDRGAARIRAVIGGNAASMAAYPAILAPDAAVSLTGGLRRLADTHAALLDARARAGRVRHVHGDLHLGNIAIVEGRAVPFDCLEFDAGLATTDVLYDLAFLLMDLWERDLRREANILFNRYLDLSAADEAGIALLPLFMSVRATVRAHVLAAQAGDPRDDKAAKARHYLDLAARLIAPVAARLVAIGGLSGSGKSTLARAVGGAIGRAPGARILRSDVLRKRIAGVGPETRLDAATYTPEAGARAYAAMAGLAEQALAAGQGVVADAVFGRPAERRAVAVVAGRAGCAFAGFWLDLDEEERVRRVERRSGDASDADAVVARMQTRALDAPVGEWTVIRMTDGLPSAARQLLDGLGAEV